MAAGAALHHGDAAAPPPAPPSHLNAFPPPLGGVNVGAALDFLRRSEVRNIPHSAVLQQNILSDGRVYMGDSALRSQSPPRPRSVFDNLPASVTPASPAKAKKAPTTVDELSEQLRSWVDNNTTLADDHALYKAWMAYVIDTVKHAHDAGVDRALQYHLLALKAAQRNPPRYDPARDGPTYTTAFFHHIQPELIARRQVARKSTAAARKAPRSASPARAAYKRTAPTTAATSAPAAGQASQAGTLLCTQHGLGNHATADCRTLNNRRPAARPL